jgi:uncharacterized protein YggE
MFRTTLSAVIGLSLVLVVPAAVVAQSDAPDPERTIIVSGLGQASAEPDEAIISLGVDVRAANAQGAMEKAARRMDAVIAALQAAGVEESDIRTVRLDLYQYRQRNAQRAVVERGWKVNTRVRAIIRDIEGTSDAIDAAVSAGATDIDSIRFRASDPAEAVAEARVAAVESAATAAETLAGASGLEVLGVVRIVESGQGYPSYFDRGDTAGGFESAPYSASTPIQPGLVDISTTVTVEYVIG